MIFRFETIESTNTYLKELAEAGESTGTAVIAHGQTGGRGRMGRGFYSPPGAGIYLSYLLRPNCKPGALMHLTCAVAVAMCDAVEESTGFRPGIKWTNDLVFGSQKLGGILTELGLKGADVDYAIVGIGINCRQKKSDFPPELQTMATSLSLVTGRTVAPTDLEGAMLRALERMSQNLLQDKEKLLDQYRRDCVTLGQQISILRGEEVRHGVALDIDSSGGLLVRYDDGTEGAVSSGEVSIRGMYGYI